MQIDTLIEQIYQDFAKAKTHSAQWRQIAKEDYDFVAGDQYKTEDKILLENQMRPAITFNRIGPVIDAICGAEISNRQMIQYIPRSEGDVGINELLSHAASWIREECYAQEEESDAFQDVVISGMGWIETRMDYLSHTDGQVMIERVDPFEMYWDPEAKKRNLHDAKWVLRVKNVALKEIEKNWPDKFAEIKANIAGQTPAYETPKKTAQIIEYQWKDFEVIYRVRNDKTGEFKKISEENFKKLPQNLQQPSNKVLRQKRTICRRAILCEKILLDYGVSPAGDSHFSYQAITGKPHRTKNQWYGLVNAMKDPQRWANKWLSQVLHIINTNAKGGLIAERNAFVNIRDAEENWADPSSIVLLKEGGLNKIKPKPNPQYPAGLERLMEFAIASIRDVSGVNLELMGLAEKDQAGVLEHERKQASMSLLSSLFSSLTQYRKKQGKVLLHFIKEYISDGRLIKMNGEKGSQYVPLTREKDTFEYDVIVDEAPLSSTQKQDVMKVLLQFMPFLQNSQMPIPEEIIDYLPLPKSLIYKWKQKL